MRVAPLRRLPAAMSVFDYEWIAAEPPRIGSLITIPFRKTTLPAIILQILSTSPYRTKALDTACSTPLLQPTELNWLMNCAARFHEPIGVVCERMLPPYGVRTRASLTRAPALHEKKIAALSYAWFKNEEDFFETVTHVLQEKKLVPRLILTYAQAHAEKLFHELASTQEHVFLYDATSDPKRRAAWHALVNTADAPIIVGTHALLWLPHHPQLEWIFIEPTHEAHASWSGAAYTNREILQDRCKTFGESITCIAHSPDTPELAQQLHMPAMSHWPIVSDRTTEDPGNRAALFSATTEMHIQKSQRAVIFVQHLKEATHLICKDCGRMVPLTSTTEATCASCHSTHLISWGFGGARVRSYLKKIDEQQRPCFLIDAKTYEKISQELPAEEPYLLISTLPLFDKIPLNDFDTIIDMATDIDFKFPVFDTEERAWKRLRAIASRLSTAWHGTWLIETRHPERAAWNVRNQAGFDAWWAQEKTLRQRFHQPPFGPLKKTAE